jgi:hypothetical protein
LQPQALLVSLDRAYCLHHAFDPCHRLEVAKLSRGDRALAGIVIREARVPPNAGVQAFRQLQSRLIGTRFLRGAIQVHEVGPGDHAHGRFAFACMHVRRRVRFVRRFALPAACDALHVHDVVVWRLELRLREKRQQAVVAAVTVHDDDLLAAVAGHLVGRFLQQLELQSAAVGHRAGLMLRFEDLPEVVLWENDGILLLGGIECNVAHVEQIVAQGKMGSMLLHDAEREQAGTLRAGDAAREFSRRQLLPMDGELGLCRYLGRQDCGAEYVEGEQE